MVFSGRPSKACALCRKRRLRCDLIKPACSQCQRAHLNCSGYRDVDQLRVKDQSQATIKRVRQKDQKDRLSPMSFMPSVEQQAKNAFFSRYVVDNMKTFDYLPSFYSSPSMDEHLSLSIDAVSMAYFSHQSGSAAVLKEARKRYVDALRLTNAALRSSDLVIKDSTLLATLLLDLFEKFTSVTPRHKGSWTSHVNGALALVKLRGQPQYADPIGLKMISRLSTNILITFVASDTALPPGFVAMRNHAARFLDSLDPKWRLSDVMIDYAAFREDSSAGRLTNMDIITAATKLIEKYKDHLLSMPPHWMYETVQMASRTEGVFGDYYHVYPNQHITQTWNVNRIMRILLYDTVRKVCLRVAKEREFMLPFDPILCTHDATISIGQIAAEICDSAPQYFVCMPRYLASSTSSGSSSPITVDESMPPYYENSQHYLQCYTMLFPLYIAARYDPTGEIRKWIITQLRLISRESHFKNAVLVAELLERDEIVDPWLVYAMLGSYAFAA